MSLSASLYPSTAILTAWSERDWRRADGVQLEHLDHMQRIVCAPTSMRTKSSSVAAPPATCWSEAGISFRSSRKRSWQLAGRRILEAVWYLRGLRLEFNVDGETILTSPIFGISLCPMELVASA